VGHSATQQSAAHHLPVSAHLPQRGFSRSHFFLLIWRSYGIFAVTGPNWWHRGHMGRG
jgi:hypothetical protein